MPEGVYYRSLDRLEETISIVGISDSYSRLTELMRRLDESEWFDNSDLSEVTRIEDGDGNQTDAYGFSLNLTLELPRDLEDEV
jgi:type IV pilus assembly protein PilN